MHTRAIRFGYGVSLPSVSIRFKPAQVSITTWQATPFSRQRLFSYYRPLRISFTTFVFVSRDSISVLLAMDVICFVLLPGFYMMLMSWRLQWCFASSLILYLPCHINYIIIFMYNIIIIRMHSATLINTHAHTHTHTYTHTHTHT